MNYFTRAACFLGIVAMLCVVVFLFSPGLSGGFWLDDYGTLPALFDSMDSEGLWRAVLSGKTGPLGRPLSLISFAVQKESWPYAYDFLIFNIVIHGFNCLLVYFLCMKILQRVYLQLGLKKSWIFGLALLISFSWAITPLQVSTVLYVVQRMTLLSSFFMLAAAVLYFLGVELLDSGRVRSAIAVVILGCGGLGVLGLFAKEIAFILIVYLLLIRYLIGAVPATTPWFFRRGVPFSLWGSCLIFLVYLVLKFQGGILTSYEIGEFSLSERLFTEARIHWQYVRQIFAPQFSNLGLFHDDYPISRGLLEPVTTLISLLCWLLLAVGVWLAYRHDLKLLVFGVGWFIGGHLLEGTVWPLELYFEHRNYVPSLGLWLIVVGYGAVLFKSLKSRVVKVFALAGGCVYLIFMCGVNYYTSALWGRPEELSVIYASERLGSIRARAVLIDVYRERGLIDEAYGELEKIVEDFPMNLAPHLIKVEFSCLYEKRFIAPDQDELVELANVAVFSNGTLLGLENLISGKLWEGRCESASPLILIPIIKALIENPSYYNRRQLLQRFMMIIYRNAGDLKSALFWLQQSPRIDYDHILAEIQLLAALERMPEARVLLKELNSSSAPIGLLNEQIQYLLELEMALQKEEPKVD